MADVKPGAETKGRDLVESIIRAAQRLQADGIEDDVLDTYADALSQVDDYMHSIADDAEDGTPEEEDDDTDDDTDEEAEDD